MIGQRGAIYLTKVDRLWCLLLALPRHRGRLHSNFSSLAFFDPPCLTTFSTFPLFGLSTHIWTFQLFRSNKADSSVGVEANVMARVISVTTRKYHYLKLNQINGDKDDDDDDDDGGGGTRGLYHEVRQSSGWLTQT